MVLQAPPQTTKVAAIPALTAAPVNLLQRKCACGGNPGPSGECEACRKKRGGMLQRSALNAQPTLSVPPIVHDVLKSPGQPLDAGTRALMEPRFGHDFSKVRVHADTKAAESAGTVSALAYTVGRDVVFGTGQYAPATPQGRKLLVHELAHVVQQGNAAFQPGTALDVAAPRDSLEGQAEAAAAHSNTGTLPFAGSVRTATLVQRAVGEAGKQTAPIRSDVNFNSPIIMPESGHEFGNLGVRRQSSVDRNGVSSKPESTDPSLRLDGGLRITAPEEEDVSMDAPISPNPFTPRPTPTPPCPTRIRVAEILHADLDAANVASGFHTGWGGVARMEVSDPSIRNWDGTRVRENLFSGANTCEPGASACPNADGQGGSSGSTFTVGAGATSSMLGFTLPAVRNCFYDMHIMGMRVNLLQQRHLPSCMQNCFQWYTCNGRPFGPMFVIDRTQTPDQINVGGASQDVTRVRLDVTEAPGPPAPQGPGDFPRRTLPVGQEAT